MRISIDSGTSFRGRNSRPNWLVLAVFISAALAAGAFAVLLSPAASPAARQWYEGLVKPEWAPPDAWMGPVWLTLYVLMGTSAWLVWRERYHRGRNGALVIYSIQLLLNAAWAPLFFGARNIGAGLFAIVALWLSIAWTMREFAAVKTGAAWLLAPYLIWVGMETWLNLTIWKLNP
jgi:tryptophan-rich sensory protein